MKIGIISLGLIGGSLFKVLCKTNNEIYAVTRNEKTIKKALTICNNVSNDLKTLSDCEVIFVASPINKTVEILDKLENIVSKDTIVSDCASVKEFVMKKKRPYKFIGSHPMAGTEFNGYDASFEDLFNGAKWILTPSDNIEEKDIKKIEKIIKYTKAQIIITTAKEHDLAAAQISHMPLLLSQALMYSIKGNKLAHIMAASGFRDMTRLSASNLEMASDMAEYNRKNIEKSLNKLYKSINFLQKTKVKKIFADIKNTRSNMYSDEGKNIFK